MTFPSSPRKVFVINDHFFQDLYKNRISLKRVCFCDQIIVFTFKKCAEPSLGGAVTLQLL